MAYIRHEDKIIKIVDNYPISDIEEKTDIQMEIRKVYKKAHILDMTTTSFQGMSADEVYRKAKAWDNYIAEVRERVKITVNTDDDVERETQKVIDYFMEDE